MVLSGVVSAAAAALLTYAVDHRGGLGDPVDVPPLEGLRVAEARALLEPRGLLLALNDTREDVRFQPGQICDQRPLEGSRVRHGETVSATVVRAPVAVQVPEVLGQSGADARRLLEAAHLLVGRVSEQVSPTIAVGLVVTQSLVPGASAHQGSAVDLVVSKGPELAPVPAVLGRSLAKAREILTQAGFVPGTIKYGSDEDRSDGVVMQQTPAAGAVSPKGSKIDLVVNQLE
jgi:serine/threonine-protein kinase